MSIVARACTSFVTSLNTSWGGGSSMSMVEVESSFFCNNVCRNGFQSVTEETKSCRSALSLWVLQLQYNLGFETLSLSRLGFVARLSNNAAPAGVSGFICVWL